MLELILSNIFIIFSTVLEFYLFLFIKIMKRYYINPNPKRARIRKASREKRRWKSISRDNALRECFLNDASRRPTYPSLHFTPVVYRHLLFIWAPVSQNRVTNFFNKVSNESVMRDITSYLSLPPFSFLSSYKIAYYAIIKKVWYISKDIFYLR